MKLRSIIFGVFVLVIIIGLIGCESGSSVTPTLCDRTCLVHEGEIYQYIVRHGISVSDYVVFRDNPCLQYNYYDIFYMDNCGNIKREKGVCLYGDYKLYQANPDKNGNTQALLVPSNNDDSCSKCGN